VMIKIVSRYLLVALIILVLLVIGYLVIVKRPLLVEVVDVEQGVPVQVFGLGTVEARILSKVGFEVGGTLVELAVDHGERVKQGAVLARLHSAEQQVRVTKAQANLTKAEAALQKDEATLERSRAILKQRQQTNRRQQALVKQQAASQEVVDEAHMNEAVAAANVTVTESEIAVARANLLDAHAQVTLEITILDHYTLYAPYDGIVIKRQIHLRYGRLPTWTRPGPGICSLGSRPRCGYDPVRMSPCRHTWYALISKVTV